MKMPFAGILKVGSPRSLGKANEVVDEVLSHPDRIGELFECLLIGDEIVRMRASDAMEKICRSHPDLVKPYLDRLLTEVADIDQPSVQWHLVQMVAELELNETQFDQALQILRHHLNRDGDWIVTNYALETFYRFVQQKPALRG